MKTRRIMALILALLMSFQFVMTASAVSAEDAMSDIAGKLTRSSLQYGKIGGEWAAMALARGGFAVPAGYYDSVVSHVKECGGVLDKRSYSEYSRVIIALTAIGKDPTNVAGYDLTAPLADYDQTIWQGINGPAWALIALDSGNYPNNVRQRYVDYIVGKELPGGGWTLAGNVADVDITAMVLQALAKYQDQKPVKAAVERAITWLSNAQNADGTFSTMGTATCESTAQVVVALCELGISVEDSRFIKNGSSVLNGLLRYYKKDGFEHIFGNGINGMATEQGFYALVAVARIANGESSLYRMQEADSRPVVGSVTFSDIAGHKNQKAIETLAAHAIISGAGDGTFAPNKTMSRAEFCTITVKALGLEPQTNNSFSDVPAAAWYAGYVGTASKWGIVSGVGGDKFNPNGMITRQEAASMVARAAKVMQLKTDIEDANEVLALFSDGAKVSSWAKDSVAYCVMDGIASWSGTLQPQKNILRCEIAQMIYNMSKMAGKI